MSWGMPIPDDPDRSEESRLCDRMADLFHEASETDCYVTRALIKALGTGLAQLSESEFGDMFAEVHDEDLHDWMRKAYNRASTCRPEVEERELSPSLGGTEEDLSDLRRAGLATCRSEVDAKLSPASEAGKR